MIPPVDFLAHEFPDFFPSPIFAEESETIQTMVLRLLDDVLGMPSEIERVAPHALPAGVHTVPGVLIGKLQPVKLLNWLA